MASIWYGHGVVNASFDIQPNQELLPLPGKLGLDVPPGTLNSVLKQAGLKD